MAVTAYVGEPGSGKTYEVVSEVIVPAIRSGRRVVTNIRGINADEIRAYLLVDLKVPESDLGSVVTFESDQIKPGFFYEETRTDTIVQPGDVVIIDECWRWFAKGTTIDPATFTFFRMHRQFVDGRGTSCDVVLISQSIQDIDRKVVVVVEKHFRMEKHKALGSKKRYTVEAFNGYKVTNNQRVAIMQRTYDPKFFPMYSSYAGKGGDEREVDGRMNIFRNPIFRYGFPLAFLMMIGGGYAFYYQWFVKPAKAQEAAQAAKLAGPGAPGVAPVPTSPYAASGASGSGVTRSAASSPWRAVGYLSRGERLFVLVESGGHHRPIFNPPNFRLDSLDVKVNVDGEIASGFTGAAPGVASGGIIGGK